MGTGPVSDKVKVYLAHFTEDARDLLVELYGAAIVVSTEPRRWHFTGATSCYSPGSWCSCSRQSANTAVRYSNLHTLRPPWAVDRHPCRVHRLTASRAAPVVCIQVVKRDL